MMKTFEEMMNKYPDDNCENQQFDCEKCRSEALAMAKYMIVCKDCGNKRCPQALDHRYKCSKSNDVGQVGELK
jgi:hypothetical protein